MSTKTKLSLLSFIMMCVFVVLIVPGAAFGGREMVLPPESETSEDVGDVSDSSSEPEEDYQPEGILGQFIKGILLVGALGAGVYYFSKKLVPKLTAGQGKTVCVLETIALGHGKSVHLIEVGQKQTLLVGSSNENINFLADVTESVSEEFKSRGANEEK